MRSLLAMRARATEERGVEALLSADFAILKARA
jgi:hypothetical protein